jgi:hypothetical protein
MTPIPEPRYRNPVEIMRRDYWECTGCGSLVVEKQLELHSVFHSRVDRLMEKLMLVTEYLENQAEREIV